jgi:large subunit ribosomal protein L22
METVEKVKKTKRSVVKRTKIALVKEAAKKGAATAYMKQVPTSPRKMRLVADLIRGQRVSYALSLLKYEAQHAAAKMEKLLLSAISNWEAKNTEVKLEDANLVVKEVFVDGGRQLKRLRPAPQGRAHRVRKRSNHVTLVVDSAPVKEAKVKGSKNSVAKETKE